MCTGLVIKWQPTMAANRCFTNILWNKNFILYICSGRYSREALYLFTMDVGILQKSVLASATRCSPSCCYKHLHGGFRAFCTFLYIHCEKKLFLETLWSLNINLFSHMLASSLFFYQTANNETNRTFNLSIYLVSVLHQADVKQLLVDRQNGWVEVEWGGGMSLKPTRVSAHIQII